MILIDTNVVSEIMRMAPSNAVLSWLNEQDSNSLYLSTVTIGEIEYGLRILPLGQRRAPLEQRFAQFVARAFEQRVLVFDEAAARAYGTVMSSRREMGRPMSVPDGQIAAIASSNDLAIATRNIKDFECCGIDLIDPFTTR